jgi:hypothetical protein
MLHLRDLGNAQNDQRAMPDALDIDVRYVRMTTGVSKIIKMLIRMCR